MQPRLGSHGATPPPLASTYAREATGPPGVQLLRYGSKAAVAVRVPQADAETTQAQPAGRSVAHAGGRA